MGNGQDTTSAPERDFVLSYAPADRAWAEWIAYQLEDEDVGYRVLLQAWDGVPGSNWVAVIDWAVTHARRTIVLLSRAYLSSVSEQAEWQAARADDPLGFDRKLLPIRLEDCPLPGLLGQIKPIDLVGHTDEDVCRRVLLDGITMAIKGRGKPAEPSPFPPSRASSPPSGASEKPPPPFPGATAAPGSSLPHLPREDNNSLPLVAAGSSSLSGQPDMDNPASFLPGVRPWIRAHRLPLGASGAVVFLAFLALLAWRLWPSSPSSPDGCQPWPGVAVTKADDGECVGYSTGGFTFGVGDDPSVVRLRDIQEKIFEQNRCADELDKRPGGERRRSVTLVYFGSLTRRPASTPGTGWADPQMAEMLALLTWQRQLNQFGNTGPCVGAKDDPSRYRIALRVVIANGGEAMGQAAMVTQKYIVPLAATPGERVIGVIGMDRSTPVTLEAIRTLGMENIPVIAHGLSADGVDRQSERYFQMVPANRRDAQLVALYAWRNNKKRITVYYPGEPGENGAVPRPDDDDTYVSTLVKDIDEEVPKVAARLKIGLSVDRRGWDKNLNMSPGRGAASGPDISAQLESEFQKRCTTQRPDDLIFYTGRQEQFGEFLKGMAECIGEKNILLLADGTVGRFVLEYAGKNIYNVPIRYISRAAPVVLAGKKCLTNELMAGDLEFLHDAQQSARFLDFCRRLDATYRATGMSSSASTWPDERVGLVYDSVQVFLDSVNKLDPAEGISWMKIVGYIRGGVFDGVTGRVDFRTSRVATDKALTVLRVDLSSATLPTPSGSVPASPDTLEAADDQTCKFVLRGPDEGPDPQPMDCWNHPLSPIRAPSPASSGESSH
ncbi:TIR domain-containing protein [Frankia sp. Cj5]|uniref:TIR domain-containing protein n=1 Tax=Frankia sp. Cj5 TaxID=2880978 RepID=UPI001EF4252C|nr:TIR domain-containing protein [Frankia sp. Cj5]